MHCGQGTLYCLSRGSSRASRSSRPSVMNLILVALELLSSNLTAYPTCGERVPGCSC